MNARVKHIQVPISNVIGHHMYDVQYERVVEGGATIWTSYQLFEDESVAKGVAGLINNGRIHPYV